MKPETAQTYENKGWHPLPLPAGRKTPPPPGATGRVEPRAAGELTWRSGGNIGIRMPANVVGIDVDHYENKHGMTSLAKAEEVAGVLPHTYVSTRRDPNSGSSIRFFRVPPGMRFASDIGLNTNVEVIQHTHRYAVAAPSVVGDMEYRWYIERPNGRGDTRYEPCDVPDVDDLPTLPARWLEMLDEANWGPQAPTDEVFRDTGNPVTTLEPDKVFHTPDEAVGPIQRWCHENPISDILNYTGWTYVGDTIEGELWRHPTATNDHSALLSRHGDRERLYNFSSNSGLAVTVPGKPAGMSAFDLTVQLRYGGDGKRAMRELGLKVDPVPQHEPGEDETLPEPLDWRQVLSGSREEAWWCRPLLARGRAHALYAGAKSGKSLLVQDVVTQMSRGRGVLGEDATGSKQLCIVVDYENSEVDLAERMESFGVEPDDAPELETYRHYSMPWIGALDTQKGAVALERLIKRDMLLFDVADPADVLVVIDTLSRAVDGPESEADTIRNYYRWTGMMLKRLGVTSLRLDHAGKDREKGARGTSAKADDVDVVWRMVSGEGDGWDVPVPIQLEATHTRVRWIETFSVTRKEVDGDLRHVLVMEGVTPEVATVMAELRSFGWDHNSVRESLRMLRSKGRRHGTSKVTVAVRMLKKQGVPRKGPMFPEQDDHVEPQVKPVPDGSKGEGVPEGSDDDSGNTPVSAGQAVSEDRGTERSPRASMSQPPAPPVGGGGAGIAEIHQEHQTKIDSGVGAWCAQCGAWRGRPGVCACGGVSYYPVRSGEPVRWEEGE